MLHYKCLFTHLNVATLQSQAKACLLIFDKVQCNLRVALFLQVGNDGLAYQLGITHHVEHLEGREMILKWAIRNYMLCCGTFSASRTNLIIFAVDQGQFEAVFCGVDSEDTRPALPVQAVNAVASHTGHIDGQVQSSDDAVITMRTQQSDIYRKTDSKLICS